MNEQFENSGSSVALISMASIKAVIVCGRAISLSDWASEMYVRTQKGMGVVV